MGGGGKSSTSTQSVSIPPEVLARYNAVNARAEGVAQQPFQAYGGEFVAPLNPTQQAGIQATSAASQLAQPYYGEAAQGLRAAQQGGANYIGAAGGQLGAAQQTGQQYGAAAGQQYNRAANVSDPYNQAATMAALAGAQGIDPGRLETGRYMNPYVGSVVGATQAAMGQQQGQQLAQQQSEAIRSGAFGGERAGLQRQTLRGQQGLAQAQAIAPLYQQGYQQALQTAQQQQGVNLGAAQANRAAIQQAGQQLQGIGQGLYGQALGVGQAVQGLGQQQYGQGAQTAQQLAALGQQGYTMGAGSAQQLAGLGTGAQQAALQGAQAQIGAGTLAQQTQQAQDTAQYQQFLQQRGYDFQVAQFLANIAMGTGALSGSTTSTTQPRGFFSNRGGFKTGESLHRSGKAYGGGLDPNSMGGAVYEPGAFERGGYATAGSVVDSTDLAAILAQQRQSFGPFAAAGPYGQAAGATPHGPSGIVPQQQMHVPKLITAGALPKQQAGVGSDLGKVYSLANEATTGLTGKGLTERAGEKMGLRDSAEKVAEAKGANMPGASATATTGSQNPSGGVVPTPTPRDPTATSGSEGLWDQFTGLFKSEGGGIMPRHRYADGGSEDSQADEAIPHDPSDVMSGKDPMEGVLKAGSQKPQMLKPSGGGGGGGGGSGKLGLGKLAGSAIGSAFGPLGSMAGGMLGGMLPFNEGGVVPRQHFLEGGDAEQPVRKYFDYLTKEKGYEPHVAAGILGNAYHESSGLQPNIVGDQGKSIGLFQFHERGEQPAFRQWASENQRSVSDPYAQIDFVHNQLQGPYAKTLEQMRSAGDPSAAAESFMRGYERPKEGPIAALDRRQAYANAIASGEKLPTFRAYAGNQGGLGGAGQEAIQRATSGEGKGLGAGQEQPGFFDRNKGIILPVLQGLGAMASSKSISPWAAALQGLGAGAKAYGDVEAQQAQIKQTEEGTRTQQATTAQTWLTAAKSAMYMADGKLWIMTKNGPALFSSYSADPSRWGEPLVGPQARRAIDQIPGATSVTPDVYGEGTKTGPETEADKGVVSGAPSGTSAPAVPAQPLNTTVPKFVSGAPTPYSLLGESAPNNIEIDKNRFQTLNGVEQSSHKQDSLKQLQAIRSNADQARQRAAQFDNLARYAMALPEEGWASQGKTLEFRKSAVDYLNELLKTAGSTTRAYEKDIGNMEAMAKIQNAITSGQRTNDELRVAAAAIPNLLQSREGFISSYASERARMQKAMDEHRAVEDYQRQYEKKYGKTVAGGWSAESALRAFNDDNPSSQYEKDQERLKWLMTQKDRNGESYWSAYKANKIPPHYVDRQTGAVGYRRYFQGFGQ